MGDTSRTGRSRRRGNREGTVYKRADGRWEAKVILDDGRRKSFYGDTRAEVARRLAEAQHEIEHGLPIPGERETVGQYLEAWIETTQGQIRPSSWRRYGDYVRVHLVPGLGRIPLAKLSAQQVQLFYARKLREGLSSSTVHHLHGVLHRALKDAVQLGLVQRNVTEQVRAPRRQRTEMTVLSEEQGNRLLAATQGDRFEALYVLALTTGMRQGELLGLRWQDVDLERAIAHVRVNVQEADGRFILAEVKTSYSRRNIALTRVAVKALRAHRARQNEERLAMGPKWDSTSDLVFPNVYGGIMIPDNLAKRSFKAALLRAGLSDMRFHDLRHTAATLLLTRGVHPKVVSEMLGHADIAITLRVYAHVLPNMQLAAVTLMDTLFGGQIGEQATEEESSERPAQQTHETQTVVNTVVNAEKDEAQAASSLGLRGGDGGESNSPSKQANETICYRLIQRFDDVTATPTGGVVCHLLSGSRQRLLSDQRLPSLIVLHPILTHQAEVRRMRFYRLLSGESESRHGPLRAVVGSYFFAGCFTRLAIPAPRPANVPVSCLSKPDIP